MSATMQLTDSTICLADPDRFSIYDFYGSTEISEQNLARANARTSYDTSPRNYRVMKLGEFYAARRAALLSRPLQEIGEATYRTALEVLPPEAWHQAADGVTLFLMCEYFMATFTNQYATIGGRYFTRMVDAKDKSTWITAAEIAKMSVAQAEKAGAS